MKDEDLLKTYENWVGAVEILIELQNIFGYQKGWLVHKLNCWSPPTAIWKYVDKKLRLNLEYWDKQLPGGLSVEDRDLTVNESCAIGDVYTEICDIYEELAPLQQRLQILKKQLATFDIKEEGYVHTKLFYK